MYRRVRLYHPLSPYTSLAFSHAHQTHAGSVWCLSQSEVSISFIPIKWIRMAYSMYMFLCTCFWNNTNNLSPGGVVFFRLLWFLISIYINIHFFFITGCCIIAQLQLAKQSKLSVDQAFHQALCTLCFFRWKIVFHMPNRWTDWESTWLSSRIAIREETFPKMLFRYTITCNII